MSILNPTTNVYLKILSEARAPAGANLTENNPWFELQVIGLDDFLSSTLTRVMRPCAGINHSGSKRAVASGRLSLARVEVSQHLPPIT